MSLTNKNIEFDGKEVIANLENIQRSLDEIGIGRSSQNQIYLQMILVIEQIVDGLTKEQILYNTENIYHLVQNNFQIRRVK